MSAAPKDSTRRPAHLRAVPSPMVAMDPDGDAVEAAMLFSLMSPEMATQEVKSALSLLLPEHLHNPANGSVFAAMQALDAAGVTIEPVTIAEKLRHVPPPVGGWDRYLSETIPADGATAQARPSEYARILIEKWRQRQAMQASTEMIVSVRAGTPYQEASDALREKLLAIESVHASTTTVSASVTRDIVAEVWTSIANASNKPTGLSWGFAGLDERIGRIQQPSYIVIGGRSGQGKTQIAWQTGLNIAGVETRQEIESHLARMGDAPQWGQYARELKEKLDSAPELRDGVYYASYEMLRTKLLSRGICVEANVPPKMVTSGKIPRERNPRFDGSECPGCGAEYRGDAYDGLPKNGRGQPVCRTCAARERSTEQAPEVVALPSPFERLTAAANLISSLPIFVDDQKCEPKKLADRFRRVRDLAAEGKMVTKDGHPYPKCNVRTLVIDSIQDTPAPPGPSNRNRTTEIQDTSKGIMDDIMKACGVGVIGLAKLTRTIDKQKDRRPQLADIRECGDIEYHADEIFFVHREQYYLRENTPANLRNIAEVIHGKGRSGLDLEAPPTKLWFAGGMFFDGPPQGWQAWEDEFGQNR